VLVIVVRWQQDWSLLAPGHESSPPRHSPPSDTFLALIYQHATRERDQKIAAGMGKEFAAAKKSKTTSKGTTGTGPKRSGTQRARGPGRAS
jgi:hypothetical protein